MYRVLSESKNGNIGIKIERKLTTDDYDLLIPYIDGLRQKVGPLKLLFDMTELNEQLSPVILGDLVNQFPQWHDIHQLAVVGNGQWMEFGKKTFNPLPKTTVKYFTSEELEKAWNWVEGDTISKI